MAEMPEDRDQYGAEGMQGLRQLRRPIMHSTRAPRDPSSDMRAPSPTTFPATPNCPIPVRYQLRDEATGPRKAADVAGKGLSPSARFG